MSTESKLGDLRIGDLVTVMGVGMWALIGPRYNLTVKRITKRMIECSDGSRWGLHGRRMPRDAYSREWIEPTTVEHLATMARARFVQRVKEWAAKLDPVTIRHIGTAQLDAAWDALVKVGLVSKEKSE